MTPFYVALHLYDPLAPATMAAGDVYGGEARLFVLTDDSLAKALFTVLESIADKGARLERIEFAGPVETFQPDHFPFEIDVIAMSDDAMETGDICSSPAYTYAPWDAPQPSGVSLAVLDLFDPSMVSGNQPYAGEQCLAAVPGDPDSALRGLLEVLENDDIRLKALEDLRDSAEAEPDEYDAEWDIAELVGEAKETNGPAFSLAFAYERED
ncbi:hypothetical protein [Tropicibacter oceani]|uniref:Uncharacterized protein n=1 Tax=Tropicibacter oceani TaxID=3058420 RepID=A0ABY8QLP0_9RHOB|nr:hypothetical protein [Tropicibacter oceani]WGW05455.1 hypothetical protein QF118_07880 [Tropicibacter oceani]